MKRLVLLALGALVLPLPAAAQPALTFPVDCQLGQTCFLQQLVDVDPGPGAQDPVCGTASYDGHTGTDIRVPQLIDASAHGFVVAAARGTVSGLREGEADRMVETDADRAAVAGRECGNGVVIDHGEGWQTQYCHLARGSVAVRVGEEVVQGQLIGAVGLSGMTQFPHLEFIVRRDGAVVDPFTGRAEGEGQCGAGASLWREASVTAEAAATSRLIGAGLSSAPIDHDTLMLADPVGLFAGADAVVGWAWAINTQAGDVFRFTLEGPDGFRFEHASEPLGRGQASSSVFAGRRAAVVPGRYIGGAQLVRGGAVIDARRFSVTVE